MMADTCNLSAQQVETGGSEIQGHPLLHSLRPESALYISLFSSVVPLSITAQHSAGCSERISPAAQQLASVDRQASRFLQDKLTEQANGTSTQFDCLRQSKVTT